MRKRIYGLPLFTLCLITLLLGSCKDDWDSHFYPEINGKSNLSLYEYIQSRPDMSTFAQLLKSKGYDSTLNSAQTFTVWAPTNSSLSGFNVNDTLAVRRLLQNHITQFSIPTAGITSKTLTMLNNKLLTFAGSGSDYSLAGKPIVEADKAMRNGIVHVLGNYVPYKLNVWEYLNEKPGLDSVRTFVNSLTQKKYDASTSFNADGVFVDSVFYDYNPVFTYLCKMKSEDSTYTTVFPDNAAWSEAYNRIFPFFKTLPASGGTATQVAYAKSTLIQDLFFSGKITVPSQKDTVVSTNGNKISNINEIIGGIQPDTLSNGLAYKTSLLKHKATESWYKEIRPEAEYIYATDSLKSNYSMVATSSIGTGVSVSNKYYLTCVPTTTSSISKLYVRFPIPNTLSTKYNIYCRFVPSSIVDTADKRPYKVKFYMTYVDANGNKVNAVAPYSKAGFDANHKLTTVTSQIATFTTDGSSPTKMLVAENFQFPFCNIVDQSGSSTTSEKTSVFLKVENVTGTSTTETKNYNRTIRIDCIILEPVQ
ncbi:fasciclin domain-containing protein [Parabacteroides sp. FAFU027]|uniref:fasciclin domain-containing protein n=1 Tax=Parabacteroides sp. FAFU027 TaxID=2922715 RepID=UPI001FAF6CD0|nr:fasciclin domain-containing protein [Parabacteroides sp. FAFU027]